MSDHAHPHGGHGHHHDHDDAGLASISGEADALYRPVEGPERWAGVPVDATGWDEAVAVRVRLASEDPERWALVARGVRLAAAHRSAVLAGVVGESEGAAAALVAGASPAAVAGGPAGVAHVVANHDALLLAASAAGTGAAALPPGLLARLHEVACRPQDHHPVLTAAGVQDHVLAHGDLKHHANHVRTPAGEWRAFAPVAVLEREVGRLEAALAGAAFAGLAPVARAGYALHAVGHVAPFAAGNGRVARALAAGLLFAAGGPPLVVPEAGAPAYRAALEAAGAGDPAALVGEVAAAGAALARAVEAGWASPSPAHAAAVADWRRHSAAAADLAARLPAALGRALARHRARPDPGWLSDLAGAEVVVAGAGVAVRAGAVEEVLAVDGHPLAAGHDGPVLRAEGEGLVLPVDAGEAAAGAGPRLDAWLDHVVMGLSVRVAAEAEDD